MNFEEIIRKQQETLQALDGAARDVEESRELLLEAFEAHNQRVQAYESAFDNATDILAVDALKEVGFTPKQYVEAQFTKKFENSIATASNGEQ